MLLDVVIAQAIGLMAFIVLALGALCLLLQLRREREYSWRIINAAREHLAARIDERATTRKQLLALLRLLPGKAGGPVTPRRRRVRAVKQDRPTVSARRANERPEVL